ncbi:MAG: hypothetical protein RBU37_18250 [Myxococcota bacterium]|nr:hypothetical protein [Myxococcota bacterium]
MPKRTDDDMELSDEFEDEDEDVVEEDEDEESLDEDDEHLLDDDEELIRAMEEEETVDPDELVFEEDAGYDPDFDWSKLDEAELARHRELLEATPEAIAEINVRRLNLFDRWAVARSCARHGLREQFQEICRGIVKARRKHDALLYEDIYLELISDLADSKLFEEAFDYLERFRKAYPDEQDIFLRVRGLLLVESGSIHEGKLILDELMSKADDHGETHLEIADDLVAMGHPELALRILERGKEFARRHKDTDLLTALDETRNMALSKINEPLV